MKHDTHEWTCGLFEPRIHPYVSDSYHSGTEDLLLYWKPQDVYCLNSHSWTDANKQISQRQAWSNGFQDRPVFSTTRDGLLSQQNLMRKPFHQSVKGTIKVKSSKAFMCRFCLIMKDGKMEWKYRPSHQPPHPI